MYTIYLPDPVEPKLNHGHPVGRSFIFSFHIKEYTCMQWSDNNKNICHRLPIEKPWCGVHMCLTLCNRLPLCSEVGKKTNKSDYLLLSMWFFLEHMKSTES